MPKTAPGSSGLCLTTSGPAGQSLDDNFSEEGQDVIQMMHHVNTSVIEMKNKFAIIF